jgi:hypothetical protein
MPLRSRVLLLSAITTEAGAAKATAYNQRSNGFLRSTGDTSIKRLPVLTVVCSSRAANRLPEVPR